MKSVEGGCRVHNSYILINIFATFIIIIQLIYICTVIYSGPKQQKKFKRLMLNRIKWGEKSKRNKHADEDEGRSLILSYRQIE